ncbi:MAG: hypothetical protein A3F10_06705 [Coxiella sp. RIFCSPHIGHO2_12_FULL_42_15]|nr:MAG: hypothetical protein A3F10_06705 [Coxiella sp. RIFCSPHIGHO2_12_FULL_42_15]
MRYNNEQLGAFWDPMEKEIKISSAPSHTLRVLAYTCHFFYDRMSPELTRRKLILNELMRQVVHGEEAAAKTTLKTDPTLLFWKAGEAIDYSGREINLLKFSQKKRETVNFFLKQKEDLLGILKDRNELFLISRQSLRRSVELTRMKLLLPSIKQGHNLLKRRALVENQLMNSH